MPSFGGQRQGKPQNIALHQQLGIPLNQPIPQRLLVQILQTPVGGVISVNNGPFGGRRLQVDTQMKYRANFAVNAGQAQQGGYF